MLRPRTIRETVEQGITTLADLQGSLLTAIQLEFSTIPLYLCAQWSINSDPSGVSGLIQGVVVQEMLHFGLACNMFTATGGSLTGQIATPDIVPNYPCGLPGGVHPGLTVDLMPLNSQALQMFMAIEYPEGAPVVPEPSSPPPITPPDAPTIGQFYAAIAAGFTYVFITSTPPTPWPNNPSLHQVNTPVDSDQLFVINSVADALKAIAEITAQGEGTSASPDEGTFDPNELAHYYTFAEVYFGNEVAPVGSGFQYSGAKVTMPTSYSFAPEAPNAPDQATFIAAFQSLMTKLEACWTSGGDIADAIWGRDARSAECRR